MWCICLITFQPGLVFHEESVGEKSCVCFPYRRTHWKNVTRKLATPSELRQSKCYVKVSQVGAIHLVMSSNRFPELTPFSFSVQRKWPPIWDTWDDWTFSRNQIMTIWGSSSQTSSTGTATSLITSTTGSASLSWVFVSSTDTSSMLFLWTSTVNCLCHAGFISKCMSVRDMLNGEIIVVFCSLHL